MENLDNLMKNVSSDKAVTIKSDKFKLYFSKKTLIESLIVMVIITTCMPQGISLVLPYARTIFAAFFIVSLLGLVAVTIRRVNVRFYLLMLYPLLFSVIETWILHGDVVGIAKNTLKHLAILIAIDVAFTNQISFEKICYRIGLSYLLLNGFSMIVNPAGLASTRVGKRVFLICTDNGLSHLMLFTLFFFLVINSEKNRGKKRYGTICMLIAVFAFELFRGDSATNIVIICTYLILILIQRVFSLRVLKVIVTGITVFINVFCLTGGKFTIFQGLFSLLGKDITMSNRLNIWNSGMDIWMKRNIWGYGFLENGYYIKVGGSMFEAHNMVLQQLLQGGVVLLILWVILLCFVIKSEKSKMNIVGLFVWALLFLVESPYGVFWFWICLSYVVYKCLISKERIQHVIET